MSDCLFGVSPVNYPDPDNLFHCLHNEVKMKSIFSARFFYLTKSLDSRLVAGARCEVRFYRFLIGPKIVVCCH